MSYYFFFSYKRGSDIPYLKILFDELSREVRDQLQLDPGAEVGFFDQVGIELGQDWEPTLANALQESAVLVCAYSPRYFESEYCGKEWQVFQMRREQYRKIKQLAGDQNAELPPVIKPVLWLPFDNDPGPSVNAVQYLYGNPEDDQNKKGLRSIVRRKQYYEDLFLSYTEWLAAEIKDASQYQLPRLKDLPPLSQVPSAFVRPPQPPGVPQQQPSVTTPGSTKHVRFIFVAADPAKFVGQRQAGGYGVKGSHWKPFHPHVTDRIGRILQHFVSSEEMDFDSEIVEFGQDLVGVVQQAYDERKIVVLLVDGWTLSWDQDSRDILSGFERNREPFYNCTVLVPWNEGDLEIQDRRDEILQIVRDTFDSRANLWKNEIFYRDSITNLDALLDALRGALESIRGEMHKRAQGKSVPGGISKPVVSNQPSQV